MIEKKHRKQRQSFVCVPCKSKKVKCDKARPVCGRCLRESVTCFYDGESRLKAASIENVDILEELLSVSEDTRGRFTNGVESLERAMSESRELEVNLWNPHNMMISKSGSRFLEYPFGPLSMVQHDMFTRALCGSLHGTTLLQWHDSIKRGSSVGNHNQIDRSNSEIPIDYGALPFVERAILKYLEMKKEVSSNSTSAWGSNSKAEPENELLQEIEGLLSGLRDIDDILANFHENIYPVFPFIDYHSFRQNLSVVLIRSDRGLKLNTLSFHKRSNLRLLVLFLLIISLSINATLQFDGTSLAQDASTISSRLLALAERAGVRMDTSVCGDEDLLGCQLYLYLSKYLDPKDLSVITTPESLLELKVLQQKAFILGLHHPPLFFRRLLFDDNSRVLVSLRWKLWTGLHTLVSYVATPDGAVNGLDLDYMQLFLKEEEEDILPYFPESERHLYFLWRKRYRFCIMVNKLASYCSSVVSLSKVSTIIEESKLLHEYLLSTFPSEQMVNSFSMNSVREQTAKFEIIYANVVGYTCLMNAYEALALYFEGRCIRYLKNDGAKYQAFMLECVRLELKLFEFLSDYLSNNFCLKHDGPHGYVINKLLCATLIKIWVFQTSILLRLSFQLQRHSLMTDAPLATSFLKKESFLETLTKTFQRQMSCSIELAGKNLEQNYFCCFQATCMFRYIVHAVDATKLASMTTKFWRMIELGERIPQSIKNAVSMKWGLDTDRANEITESLSSPCPLTNNEEFLGLLADLVQKSSIGQKILNTGDSWDSGLDKFLETESKDVIKQFSELLSENSIFIDDPPFLSWPDQ